MTHKTISWSKTGFIAYASGEEHHNVHVTHLEAVRGNLWQLAPPHKLAVKTKDAEQLPIEYLAWSTVGDYLACLGRQGSITIFASGICESPLSQYVVSFFNNFVMVYADQGTESDESSAVVGFQWLQVEKKTVYHAMPAVRVATSADAYKSDPHDEDVGYVFLYNFQLQPATGCAHPVLNKQACLGVRTNGEVCLWYQSSHKLNFFEATCKLDADGDRVSHASFAFNQDGSVALIVYSKWTGCLKLYKVEIDWGSIKDKQKVPEIAPSLKVRRVLKEVIPATGVGGQAQEVTHLKFVSQSYVSDSELCILVGLREQCRSLIRRYQIMEEGLPLNGIFSAPKKQEDVKKTALLSLKNILKCPAPILRLDSIEGNLFIYIVYTNGDVSIRDANTFKECSGNDEKIPTIIRLMFDAGFRFARLPEPASFATMSPNTSALAYLQGNRLRLQFAQRPGAHNQLNPLEKLGISAAFAHSHSSCCFSNSCADDLIAAVLQEISRYRLHDPVLAEKLVACIIQESHSALKFSLVYTNDQLDRLLGNPPLQRLLSLQMALGSISVRSKSGRIAWALLNLRLCAFGIIITLKAWYKDVQSPSPKVDMNWRAEIIAGSLGVVEWIVSFITYICQDLFNICVGKVVDSKSFSMSDSIVLPFIMAKVPRILLVNSIKALKQMIAFASKFIAEYSLSVEVPVYSATQRLKNIIVSSLVGLEAFEKFLVAAELAVVLQLNKNEKRNQVSILGIEQKLLCQGIIHNDLKPAAAVIVTLFRDTIRKEINVSQLYYYDLEWLGMSKFIEPLMNRGELVDYLRKNLINGKVKRCVRCGSIANLKNERHLIRGNNNWDVAFQRYCFCGASWVTDSDDLVKT